MRFGKFGVKGFEPKKYHKYYPTKALVRLQSTPSGPDDELAVVQPLIN
jgi:hypothetical protein